MKKVYYYISWVVVGILLQFIVHGLLEIWYLGLLADNFGKYGFGFTWGDLVVVHYIATAMFLAIGILFGMWQASYWWKKLYGKGR